MGGCKKKLKNSKQVVLITGASSGIGRAIAKKLTDSGFQVYGTSRREQEQDFGWRMLVLDVCQDESVQAAIEQVMALEGRIDILINNAGYGDAGAVEDMTVGEGKRQFETNFFGVLRMCQAVLPIMRAQGKGRIINVGSVAGFIAVPFFGMYGATKAALASLTESLRMEVKPFGIQVALLEPGDIKTEGAGNILLTAGSEASPYESALKQAVAVMAESEKVGIAMTVIAEEMLRLIQSEPMPIRCVVNWQYRLIRFAKRLLPDSLLEWVVIRMHK